MDRETKWFFRLMGVIIAFFLTFSVIAFLEWRTRIGELAECQAWRQVIVSGKLVKADDR